MLAWQRLGMVDGSGLADELVYATQYLGWGWMPSYKALQNTCLFVIYGLINSAGAWVYNHPGVACILCTSVYHQQAFTSSYIYTILIHGTVKCSTLSPGYHPFPLPPETQSTPLASCSPAATRACSRLMSPQNYPPWHTQKPGCWCPNNPISFPWPYRPLVPHHGACTAQHQPTLFHHWWPSS